MCETVAKICISIKSTSLNVASETHKILLVFVFGSNNNFILLSERCIYSSKVMVNLCG